MDGFGEEVTPEDIKKIIASLLYQGLVKINTSEWYWSAFPRARKFLS